MLSPQLKLPLHTKLVIDLCAGGGGASGGTEQAVGTHAACHREPAQLRMAA